MSLGAALEWWVGTRSRSRPARPESGGVLSRASWAWPWVEAGLVDGWAPLDVSDEPAPQCPAPRFDLVQLLRPHDARLSCRRRIELTTSGCQRAGLRLGEVMGLRWQDIDFYGRSPKVNQVLQITMEFDIPKTHRSSRTVSLPAFVVEALKRQRKRQNERRLIIGQAWQDFGLVINRGDGAPLRACVSMAQTVDLACPSTWHGSGKRGRKAKLRLVVLQLTEKRRPMGSIDFGTCCTSTPKQTALPGGACFSRA
jgi:hypothetical protein